MASISTANPWAFVFGLIGNIVSFMVYLSPMPTLIGVVRKKSLEGLQCFPYLVALLSAMLWIYYAWAKQNPSKLIIFNYVGCVIEVVYISIFITYKEPRATAVMVAFINFGVFGAILVLTQFLTEGETRIQVLGWIGIALSTSAPLTIIRRVLRTKSVEFMPFWTFLASLVIAISGILNGIFLRDIYIAASNILGFIFAMAQTILYAIYRKNKGPAKQVDDSLKLTETVHEGILKPSDTPPAVTVHNDNIQDIQSAAAMATAAVVAVAAAQPHIVVQVGNCSTEKEIPGSPDGSVPGEIELTAG